MKQKLIYLLTVLCSVLLLWGGNKIATEDLALQGDGAAAETVKVRVVEITARVPSQVVIDGITQTTQDSTYFKGEVLAGARKGQVLFAKQQLDPLMGGQPDQVQAGDKVLLTHNPDEQADTDWIWAERVRSDALIWPGVVFCLVLFAFGRAKGVNTILSLGFTIAAIFAVFVPAILSGHNVYLWAILVCAFIVVMTLLIVNGPGRKSLAAGLGCAAGVLITGLLTFGMDKIIRLTGMVDENSMFLTYLNGEKPLDLKAIIFGAIIIGAVGAIMDVAVDIAASLYEIKRKLPQSSFHSLVRSGYTIGRDILGTMANTLVLAYIGSSLSVVLLLFAYNDSLLYILNREMIVVEILQALVGSFGILLTIPATSLICGLLYGHRGGEGEDGVKKAEEAPRRASWEDLPNL